MRIRTVEKAIDWIEYPVLARSLIQKIKYGENDHNCTMSRVVLRENGTSKYTVEIEFIDHFYQKFLHCVNQMEFTNLDDAVANFEKRCIDLELPYHSSPMHLTYDRGYMIKAPVWTGEYAN